MTKQELIVKLTEPKYREICKRLTKGRDHQDLLQEITLHFLEQSEILIEKIREPDAYIYRTLLSLISKRGKFHEKYRTYICQDIKQLPVSEQYDHQKESDLTKVEKALSEIYWCDREVLKVYLEKGSSQKTALALNIPLSTTKYIINRAKQTIKSKMVKPKILICMQHNITALQYHRQIVPHERLTITHPDKFEFIYNRPDKPGHEATILWMTDEELKEYSLVIFLRQVTHNPAMVQPSIDRLKSLGIKIVIDIDDYWNLPKNHHWYEQYKVIGVATTTTNTLKQVDYVTTTTNTFAEHISEHNTNITILPNCIHPEEKQFKQRKIENARVRFAWIGGVFHKEDIKIMEDGIKKLYQSKELNNKWQLCVGGYSNNPQYFDIEKVFTNNYEFKKWDATYYEYLMQQTSMCEHISFDKCYRRLWGRDVTAYGELYNECDVCLIPLEDNTFNHCKSELKIVEAGWMKKAVIVSNISPYKQWIKDGVNGLVVNPSRNNIDWFVAMRKLILNPGMREDLAGDLHETIITNFDLDKHNLKRVEIYKQLTK